jgi:hypothetical protein
MLAFDFYRKYQFMTKTDQNSIFYGHESRIPCRLHIVVMHINFYGLKKIKFRLKSEGVSIEFTEKCKFAAKSDRNSVF